FGVIFQDDIAGARFWGHCDMDVIFGDVRKFVTEELLTEYTKLFIHGHFSLYRNCEAANQYFTLKAPGITYTDVFTSEKAFAFDEFSGVRTLLMHHQIPFFRNDSYLADIDPHYYRLRTVDSPNYPHQCFYWERGKVHRGFWEGRSVQTREYLYIHLQQRPMRR